MTPLEMKNYRIQKLNAIKDDLSGYSKPVRRVVLDPKKA
jgi:hypothetical protein